MKACYHARGIISALRGCSHRGALSIFSTSERSMPVSTRMWFLNHGCHMYTALCATLWRPYRARCLDTRALSLSTASYCTSLRAHLCGRPIEAQGGRGAGGRRILVWRRCPPRGSSQRGHHPRPLHGEVSFARRCRGHYLTPARMDGLLQTCIHPCTRA